MNTDLRRCLFATLQVGSAEELSVLLGLVYLLSTRRATNRRGRLFPRRLKYTYANMQDSVATFHTPALSQLERNLAPIRRRHEFIDQPTLMLLHQIGAGCPLTIWQVRGRAAIYPALSRREWLWLRDWCEFAEARKLKRDSFFYYQGTGGRVL